MGQHGPWVVWVTMDSIATCWRMCTRCGYTQVIDTNVQVWRWQDVPDSVVGTSCTDQQAPDPDKVGYTTPTP